ncbi:uncharacterized protein M421DRAFT_306262 [Didymella exigua CBS 183.55]|uniref:Uncharacterized protein n=1 Tax=Didymella exigua CBS 183.55 TaxID=1150837 RepID=A0A6A5R9D8_9PLEO|nr:uncharacterized protein M421DRAFT_306262 [Didymella exigua CBS 183.55]KAF1923808.1 hypothetical protein M421DRAFT_306262 [Didymella exigua CBS 183.55]
MSQPHSSVIPEPQNDLLSSPAELPAATPQGPLHQTDARPPSAEPNRLIALPGALRFSPPNGEPFTITRICAHLAYPIPAQLMGNTPWTTESLVHSINAGEIVPIFASRANGIRRSCPFPDDMVVLLPPSALSQQAPPQPQVFLRPRVSVTSFPLRPIESPITSSAPDNRPTPGPAMNSPSHIPLLQDIRANLERRSLPPAPEDLATVRARVSAMHRQVLRQNPFLPYNDISQEERALLSPPSRPREEDDTSPPWPRTLF